MKWKERLHKAEIDGTFNDLDKVLAKDWCTCAVGELILIPKGHEYREGNYIHKKSPILHRLGNKFCLCVVNNEIDLAIDTYEKIQVQYKREVED